MALDGTGGEDVIEELNTPRYRKDKEEPLVTAARDDVSSKIIEISIPGGDIIGKITPGSGNGFEYTDDFKQKMKESEK